MSQDKKKPMKLAIHGNDDDDDGGDDMGGGMGEQSLSLEGFFAANPTVAGDSTARAAATTKARAALASSVEEEPEYFARIASTVYGDEVPEGALDKVQDEFKDFAKTWMRQGHDLNLIGDFKTHRQNINDRVDAALDRKKIKKEAAERKARSLAAAKGSSDARTAAQAAQRANQAARDAQRAAARAELEAEMWKPLDKSTLPAVDFQKVLDDLEAIDERYFQKPASDGIFTDLPDLSPAQRASLNAAYDHMIGMFHDVAIKKRHGYSQQDHTAPKIAAGGPVKAYFANVKGESTWCRKYYSLLGLRNLIIYGPTAYSQLVSKHFVGNINSYADSTGLKLIKAMTGTVVDLDTTVLRCSCPATLNAINASNKHKKLSTFPNTDAFGKSTQAQEIAIACSVPLLQDFAAKMKLTTDAQLSNRGIAYKNIPPQGPVHIASDNNDRGGSHAIWQYTNCGVNSFHANVPNLEEVNGALLKAPFFALRHYAFIFAVYGASPDLDKRVDRFFDECIADSCLNHKWRAIVHFGESLAHEGTIVDVLQKTQMQHQAVFSAAFFEADDDDQTAEKSKMWELVFGKKGRETTSGKVRDISRADVDAWVVDPSVKI